MSTQLKDKLTMARTAQASGKPGNTVYDLVERLRPELQRALPGQIDANRFVRVALTTLRLNPALAACNQPSLLGALMLSAQLGLEPGGPLGHAYLVPYGKEVTFILGYRGMIDLARRSGKVSAIYAHAVHERDEFHYSLGLHPTLEHVPADGDRGAITHVYAVARFNDGSEPQFVVLSKDEVEKFRGRSRAGKNGPWVSDYDAMARKTAVRRLFNWLPQSVEMAAAVAADEQKITHPTSLESLDFEELPQLTEGSEDVAAGPQVDAETGEIREGESGGGTLPLDS